MKCPNPWEILDLEAMRLDQRKTRSRHTWRNDNALGLEENALLQRPLVISHHLHVNSADGLQRLNDIPCEAVVVVNK